VGAAVATTHHSRGAELRAIRAVALIGSYVPRECGVATFTWDLHRALAGESPSTRTGAVAVNDVVEGYPYPPEVEFEIAQNTLADYRAAAEYLNTNGFEVACLQHEFGLYGGTAGEHVIKLVRELRMPVVATLHTIQHEPPPAYRRVLCDLADACDRLVAMTYKGAGLLREVYGVADEKVAVIPHGVPDTPFLDSSFYKDQIGVAGRKVLLTFGLLSPGKGIETVIRALPEIARRQADVVYIVLGATHPHLKRAQGEAYRLDLQRLSRSLGVDDRVVFHNRFVELYELCEYLGAADVYVTPYLNAAQITSGTLAYAMAAGKAIVSTPYWHAEETLGDGRGVLVPFGDSPALAVAISELLEDDARREQIRRRAYEYARSHVWKEVARHYLALFDGTRGRARRSGGFSARTLRSEAVILPELKFAHLRRLTDDVGVLQHATYSIPNRGHGYCIDDNARALLVSHMVRAHVNEHGPLIELSQKTLSFIQHAFNPQTGFFRNFLGYDRHWLEERGSHDAHARTLWALGLTVRSAEDADERALAAELFWAGLPGLAEVDSLRAAAHAILGLQAVLQREARDEAVALRDRLVEQLAARYRAVAEPEWYWLEDRLTYSNAAIPHALIAVGRAGGAAELLETGLRSLTWLAEVELEQDRFVPIGNDGWYVRGQARARFDQQPLEAATMVAACVEAYRATGEPGWLRRAEACFRWFLGDNDIGRPVYIDATGACCDGIHAQGLNRNRGAESTLAWLYSLAYMHDLQAEGLLSGSGG